MPAFERRGEGGRIDRDEVLRRTDLPGLADELLGHHVGSRGSAKWPSPVPGHPQTGKSPPMSIYTTRRGEQRWTCFATGTGGTAIDLVMVHRGVEFREALHWLADRAGIAPGPEAELSPAGPAANRSDPGRTTPRPPVDEPAAGGERDPRRLLDVYVATCARRLWKPEGERALAWLTAERGLDPAVLERNRVGFDPGPDGFGRPKGLPHRGRAVVLPVLDDGDRAIYCQARYLDPDAAGRKYDNPPGWLATNPKLATIRLRSADQASAAAGLIVAEGIPDALAAASHDFAAVAVLGAANATRDLAQRLSDRGAPLVIIFDNDAAGGQAAQRLLAELEAIDHPHGVAVCTPPAPHKDLAEWLVAEAPSRSRNLRYVRGRNASKRELGLGA